MVIGLHKGSSILFSLYASIFLSNDMIAGIIGDEKHKTLC